MKNIMLSAFVFLTLFSRAQTTKPIEGFLGVKFGSSQAQVIDELKAKGCILNPGQTTNRVSFSNITLAGRKVAVLFVSFFNDHAYEGSFIFQPDMESNTIEYYNSLVTDVSGVYGPGKPSKTFKKPYKDGDGYEITALKTGNASYETDWRDGDNEAWITIQPNRDKLTLMLIYRNDKLYNNNKEAQKAKNKSEF